MFIWTEESAAFRDDSARYTRCYDQLAEKAVPLFAPGSTVFEGGCGLGHLATAIAKSGFPVTGMDLSSLPLQYFLRSAAQANVPLTVREGDTEAGLGRRYVDIARSMGAAGYSFSPLICFGPHCAEPHHDSDETPLKLGDSIIFDVGLDLNKAMSDMTRTVFFGEPTE